MILYHKCHVNLVSTAIFSAGSVSTLISSSLFLSNLREDTKKQNITKSKSLNNDKYSDLNTFFQYPKENISENYSYIHENQGNYAIDQSQGSYLNQNNNPEVGGSSENNKNQGNFARKQSQNYNNLGMRSLSENTRNQGNLNINSEVQDFNKNQNNYIIDQFQNPNSSVVSNGNNNSQNNQKQFVGNLNQNNNPGVCGSKTQKEKTSFSNQNNNLGVGSFSRNNNSKNNQGQSIKNSSRNNLMSDQTKEDLLAKNKRENEEFLKQLRGDLEESQKKQAIITENQNLEEEERNRLIEKQKEKERLAEKEIEEIRLAKEKKQKDEKKKKDKEKKKENFINEVAWQRHSNEQTYKNNKEGLSECSKKLTETLKVKEKEVEEEKNRGKISLSLNDDEKYMNRSILKCKDILEKLKNNLDIEKLKELYNEFSKIFGEFYTEFYTKFYTINLYNITNTIKLELILIFQEVHEKIINNIM